MLHISFFFRIQFWSYLHEYIHKKEMSFWYVLGLGQTAFRLCHTVDAFFGIYILHMYISHIDIVIAHISAATLCINISLN